MPEKVQNKIIEFFEQNRIIVVSDILKGRGGLSTQWMLVTKYNGEKKTTDWILKNINEAMNFFGKGEIAISPKGSLYIGKNYSSKKR